METNTSAKMLSKKMLPAAIECAVCAKFGNLFCERCGETYCSKFCQLNDWREHRRYCMPVPRLVQRSDIHENGFPAGRMLMAPESGFDATDAMGSVSEHSLPSDSVPLSRDQVTKLASSLNQLQIESKHQPTNSKPSLSEIEEVLSTPPATPVKKIIPEIPAHVEAIDENANYKARSEVKQPEPVNNHVVLTPPPKKQQHFNPSVKIIQTQMKVVIVNVENSQTVHVVPSEELEKWKKFIETTKNHAKTAPILKNPPEVGYIVLAKPQIGDSFLRGLVKKIRNKDQVAKVEFMEYGFTDIVRFTDMKCLTEDLVNAPRMVNMISLKGAPNSDENAHEIKNFLTSLQENQSELIVKHLELIEKTAVCAHFNAVLVDGEKFVMINEQIKQLVAVEPAPENVEMEDIVEPSSNKKNEVQLAGFSGQNLELYVLDNSFLHIGCFSAIQVQDMALLGKNDAFINDNAKEFEAALPFHPRNDEACLAQSAEDQRWYRALSQGKIDDNTYTLMYLDYGNMEDVPVDRIREMRGELFFPSITLLCFIDGLNHKEMRKEAVDRLKTLISPYTQITFDEVQFTGEDAMCKSNNIINILKNENLI